MINAQSGVASIGVAKIIPEGIDGLSGMRGADRIHPAMPEQMRECFANFGSEQRVVNPAFWLIHVGLRRYHVVIAGQNDRSAREKQFGSMRDQTVQRSEERRVGKE